jgi:hypothetical protein
MADRVVACPLCKTEDVEVIANIPVILLCKCRKCLTAFTVTPNPVVSLPDA